MFKNPDEGISHYKGEFKKGKFHGEGHIKWTDSSKPAITQSFKEYKGQFQNGKPHG